MNIYAMLKIGSATGNSLYRMGAQMRGESYEEFLKTRNISGASLDGEDRRRHRPVARPLGRPGASTAASSRTRRGSRCSTPTCRCASGWRSSSPTWRSWSTTTTSPTSASTSTRPSPSARPTRYPIADEGFGTRPLPEVAGDAEFSLHLCESLIARRVRPHRLPGDGRRARLPRADEPLLPAHAGWLAGEERAAAGERGAAPAADRLGAASSSARHCAARSRAIPEGFKSRRSWAPAACRTSCRASASAS